jgi:hypothetical protein
MTRNRTSIIWNINKEEIQNLLDTCSSFVEVLGCLGLSKHSGNHRTLNERIKQDNLNVEILIQNRKQKISSIGKKKKIPSSEIFVEDSKYPRSKIKQRIIDENIFDYICDKCGNTGVWNDKKLVLQLDHKNGNPKDNRLENLCFLCPNCHSQTETYSGKNYKKINIKTFCICGTEKRPKSKMCKKCSSSKEHLQKFYVSSEELQKLIFELPIVQIAKIFGVSDNAIRKRCNRFGINYKKRKSG